MTLDNLPYADPLDGTELIPVQQAGVWKLVTLAAVLATTPAAITATPTGFTATPISESQIDLAFTGSGDFILERSPDESSWQQIYTGSTPSFSDTDLYPDNQYWYRVAAKDTGEVQSEWAYADATTLPPP